MGLMSMVIVVAFCTSGWGQSGKKDKSPVPAKSASEAKEKQGKTPSGAYQKIVDGARKEGQMSWWVTTDPVAARNIIADFNKVYPFIKVNYLEIATDEAGQRMKLETAAGKCSADVFGIEFASMSRFESEGLLMRWDPSADGFKVPKDRDAIDKNKMAFAYDARLYVIGYNTNLVKPQEAPKSWKDLLDPKWKDKIVTKMKPNAFTYFLPLWGEEKTLQYVKDFAKNKPPLQKSGSTVMQLVAAGEHPIGIVYYHQAIEMIYQGAPLAYVLAEPIPMSVSYLVIAGEAPHPNAAKLWIAWVLSKAGQESCWRNYRSSLSFPEVAASEFLSALKGKQIAILGAEAGAKFDIDSLLEKYYRILSNKE